MHQATDVIVLSSHPTTAADRRAQKIAEFLGAETKMVALGDAKGGASGDTADELRHGCTCLVVDAETLAQGADTGTPDAAIQSVIGGARNVFVFGFEATERHGAIAQSLSEGAVVGIRPAEMGAVVFEVAHNQREICGPFSGLSISSGPVNHSSFARGNSRCPVEDLIQSDSEPFFVRVRNGESQVYLCAAAELADLDEILTQSKSPLEWFSTLIPLAMFLRASLGTRLWHNPEPSACFIVDDPRLTERYGFLQHRQLVEIMRHRKFCVCIAFIPWNHRRSNRTVAELVAATGQPYLCIHGCDHTRGEFASSDSDLMRAKATLALKRMRAHRDGFGVQFDEVMVFPQGLFSVEALGALKAAGYLAAVNSDVFPSSEPTTLTLREFLNVAVTKFEDFPLFARRYPRNLAEFAFDLFMGKPVLVVEHHGYFRDGYSKLQSFVDGLNRLDERLVWRGLGATCSATCLSRSVPTGEIQVRFYTSHFRWTNREARARDFVFFQHRRKDAPESSVRVNGKSHLCTRDDNTLRITLTLEPGQSADIEILPASSNSPAIWQGNEIYQVKVHIRRLLSEFRDNYVDTNRVLSAVVSAVRGRSAPTGSTLRACETSPPDLRAVS